MMSPAVPNVRDYYDIWLRHTLQGSVILLINKESLLNVAKHNVHLSKEETDSDDLRELLVMEERAKYLKGGGESFSWDEVKGMAVNKEKRNGL